MSDKASSNNVKSSTVVTIAKFSELSASSLYSILRLRSEVFVLEQTCLYQDMDNKDMVDDCEHVLMHTAGVLCAYARILPPGISYKGASIGRVLVASQYRHLGLATELMKICTQRAFTRYPNHPIDIGAQCYLKDFYAALGFVESSEPYDEDGIMHIDMTLNKH